MLAHSIHNGGMNLYDRAASIVCLSGLSVCLSKIATAPRQMDTSHLTCTQWSPGWSASRLCSRSRSKVARYGQFCCSTYIAIPPRQMGGYSSNSVGAFYTNIDVFINVLKKRDTVYEQIK